MSWMLLQVYHEISENADCGDVVAYDTIIQSLKLEPSFDRHTHKRPLGHRLGRLLGLHLNNYCTDRSSKNTLGKWYADQPALQERLKLKLAELSYPLRQHGLVNSVSSFFLAISFVTFGKG
jgi:hypothetical protein